jgi:hypothetical protein
VGERLGVAVRDETAGALALSLQALKDACQDDATSQVRARCVCVCGGGGAVCIGCAAGVLLVCVGCACASTGPERKKPVCCACAAHVCQALMLLATKPMQLAQYFCTATAPDPASWRHYALAIGHYTHFTSPIR